MASHPTGGSAHKTGEAFSAFRAEYPAKPPVAELIKDKTECDQMTHADGLLPWMDGNGPSDTMLEPKVLDPAVHGQEVMLWAVLPDDVVYAKEFCPFGAERPAGAAKHTNLTGGRDAHCGGELLKLDDMTIVVNGKSGRYGPSSNDEMMKIARAFRDSGYDTMYMKLDQDTGFPLPFFGGTLPERLS